MKRRKKEKREKERKREGSLRSQYLNRKFLVNFLLANIPWTHCKVGMATCFSNAAVFAPFLKTLWDSAEWGFFRPGIDNRMPLRMRGEWKIFWHSNQRRYQ